VEDEHVVDERRGDARRRCRRISCWSKAQEEEQNPPMTFLSRTWSQKTRQRITRIRKSVLRCRKKARVSEDNVREEEEQETHPDALVVFGRDSDRQRAVLVNLRVLSEWSVGR
jgi:hypothetical protein